MTGGELPASTRGMRTMKDSAIAPEIADPYATLEKILKIIGRSWLSEEWRLEDIRLLAQEAVSGRAKADDKASAREAIRALQSRLRSRTVPEMKASGQRSEGLSS
jgi:hypothetical protein